MSYRSLNNHRYVLVLVLLAWSGQGVFLVQAQEGPRYATPETKQLVERMIEAHGGLAPWRAATAVRYDHVLYIPGEAIAFSPSYTSQEVIDQPTRRTYQDYPADEAVLVDDGTQVWTTNWALPNPPRMMARAHYYFLFGPWLTQDTGVLLEAPGRGALPGDDKEYLTVKMTFEAHEGKSTTGYYRFFIDPDTYEVRGNEYLVTYGAFLDLLGLPDGAAFGPITHVYDRYTRVDGLKVPVRYHTYNAEGVVYGYHVVLNYALDVPFDEARMVMAPEAVVDTSTNQRALSNTQGN